MHAHARVLASLCLGTVGLAQVSPSHFTSVDGNAGTRSPLATGSTSRTLQLHGDLTRSRLPIRGLAFRRDSNNRATFSALSLTLTVAMSTGATSVAAPSANFDANHGADRITVFTRRAVNFPSSAPRDTLPAPFDYTVAFDRPFAYTAFGPSGPLVWDMIVEAPALGTERPLFDFVRLDGDSDNPRLVGIEFGTGCLATGRTEPMRAVFASSPQWASNTMAIQLGGSHGPANGVAVGVLGFSNIAFGGTPLPLAVPGSQSGTSGLCQVFNDAVLSLPTALTVGGSSTLQVQARIAPELHGLTFFHQLWAVDPPANPLGLVTSSASARQLVAPFSTVPVSRVEGLGQTGPTGTVTLSAGVVTRFVR
jgi:hypothetical protein